MSITKTVAKSLKNGKYFVQDTSDEYSYEFEANGENPIEATSVSKSNDGDWYKDHTPDEVVFETVEIEYKVIKTSEHVNTTKYRCKWVAKGWTGRVIQDPCQTMISLGNGNDYVRVVWETKENGVSVQFHDHRKKSEIERID